MLRRSRNNLPKTLMTSAVVKVGAGRGFVVGAEHEQRYIITAAHCLPRSRYPRPHLANGCSELAFPRIIGPLGSKRAERTIWAELCVLNLTDDVAVLAEPDGQSLWDESDRYLQFTEPAALTVERSPAALEPYLWKTVPGKSGWVLSLDRTWVPCTVHNGGRFLTISGAKIEGGMSGSPILNAEGAAIGLISTAGDTDNMRPNLTGDNMHPSLTDCLPPWLLRKLAARTDDSDDSSGEKVITAT
jgi:hypothetical protein